MMRLPRSTLALSSALLLVLLEMMRAVANGQLKNSSLDIDTQRKVDNVIKWNATIINQPKSVFTPSFHLGPIESLLEPSNNVRDQESKSPFNAEPQNVRFGDRTNTLFNNLRTIKFDNAQDDYNKSETDNRLPDKDSNTVKFVYDNYDYQEEGRLKKQNIIKFNQRYSQLPSRFEHIEYPDGQYQVQDVNYIDENYGTGQQYIPYKTKPSKFHDPTIYTVPPHQVVQTGDPHYLPHHHGETETFYTDEKYIKPDTIINVHPMSYQATSFDMHAKPKTVVYVTSHDMVTKKFPYQYYQPTYFNHPVEPVVVPEVDTEHHQYPVIYEHEQKSLIPWKKIFHLIGAFLPLGLLFALLTPKVNNANHNPDSNIVLSKLRINDLPAEHKLSHVPFDKEHDCTERLICRLMAAADPVNTNFLRHLLMQVTARTLESAVRKKEFERIFEAAKLGNCDILTCNFYDGT